MWLVGKVAHPPATPALGGEHPAAEVVVFVSPAQVVRCLSHATTSSPIRRTHGSAAKTAPSICHGAGFVSCNRLFYGCPFGRVCHASDPLEPVDVASCLATRALRSATLDDTPWPVVWARNPFAGE